MKILTESWQVAGDWWTVWGQSCGQEDEHGVWAGAYDWYPCSHARFFQVEEGEWINNTTYCAGSDSNCVGDPLVTAPQVYWSSPGVLRHDYPQSEAPVIPQVVLQYAQCCLIIPLDRGLEVALDQRGLVHSSLVWVQPYAGI